MATEVYPAHKLTNRRVSEDRTTSEVKNSQDLHLG